MAASKNLTPEQRTLRARMAAHALHAKGGTTTEAARSAFLARFEREVDPGGVLHPDVRAKRAHHAMQAHMAGLALKSSQARGHKEQVA